MKDLVTLLHCVCVVPRSIGARFIDEYLLVFKAKNENKMRKENQLHEIEIREVDREKRLKIH